MGRWQHQTAVGMHRHSLFDLWLHDDQELAELLGSPVVSRTTIHEWPLSCVQRVVCAAGPAWIYKAQTEPTVEPEFCAQARSPVLAAARVVPHDHGPAALLLEDVTAPRLGDQVLDSHDRLATVERVLAQIAQIGGELPAVADLRTPARWRACSEAIADDLRALVADGLLVQVGQPHVARFVECARSPEVLAAINGPSGYVHSDLLGGNVLLSPDRQVILDWQRPVWGPVALDRLTLLQAVRLHPAEYLPVGVLQLRQLLLVGWLAQCGRSWFPAGNECYDPQIAGLIERLARPNGALTAGGA